MKKENNLNNEKVEKSEVSQKEEEVLAFWEENNIFEKSEEKDAPNGEFVFYDGPPFATGLPHYGHLVAGTIKDVIPRYQTMLGKKVARRWGWDCHGLPIENLIEKELNLKTKKDIEDYGIEKFNKSAHDSVLRYDKDWKKIVPRSGRWVNMKESYKTMDAGYTESIWWAFKDIFNKGLIYEGFKSMHLCPRCETTLSNFEVNQGYKDVTDISVIAKFELEDEPNTFLLAWTTTPWTLPGNVALAVNPEVEYIKIKRDTGEYILAKELVTKFFDIEDFKPEKLKTDRLVLEAFDGSYSEEIVFLLKDESDDFYSQVYHEDGLKRPENEDYINKLYGNKNVLSWVILEEEKVIGVVSLNKFNFNIEYWISAKRQNKGFMTEALKTLSDSLIDQGLPRVVLSITKENIASQKVAKKSDFSFFEEKIFGSDDIMFYFEKVNRLNIIKGSDLIGKSYKPVFDYHETEDIKNKENGWKIYGADFVTTEDGTGIVHIAPAFGSDDLELGQKNNLSILHHVGLDGRFKDWVKDFAGNYVKPKDDPQSADIEIIKNLAHRGLLFDKKKITHSYPHCWRCDTPLLNYATSSWFLKVTDLKDKLIAENKKVSWVPADIRDGRFGKWLEGARDWAISRSRFWGAPLPVWKCESCESVEVAGSVEDIKEKTKSTNKYFVMRHGEAESNVLGVSSTKLSDNHHNLTEKGREEASNTAESLKDKKIDLIFASPFLRTKQTAELVAENIGLKKEDIIFDERIMEVQTGIFHGKPVAEYSQYYKSQAEKFEKAPPEGESLTTLKNRVTSFLYEIDKKYSDKNILIVSHQYPVWLLFSGAGGLDAEGCLEKKEGYTFNTAEMREIDFAPISHNENYELDLHRPYIDKITFGCDCGGKMKNIKEVFDCWFESGSMPYASHHYPFENLDKFNPEKGIGFPADFISEGLDQTRGWFYTLLVLSVALFEKTPFENVIVNGLVLAEDGQKMSKRLKNYPEVSYILNKYGTDALRYYLISSPLMKSETLNFSEKGVDEVLKKIILRLKNVYSFYELYKDTKEQDLDPNQSQNVLDKWILERLKDLGAEVTKGLNNYELDRASRPILDFIDDLSTWYIRRSRDRFKGEDREDRDFALATTQFVLKETVKIIAPFMPFVAEEIYQKVKGEDGKESVHLESWSEYGELDQKLLEEMEEVRKTVSLGLEARAKEGVKVRQPLGLMKIKNEALKDSGKLLELIKDEVNVKEVSFESGLEEEVELDLNITEDLKQEGQYRDFLRNLQGLRKKAGLTPDDLVKLQVQTSEDGKALIQKFEENLKKTALISEIVFGDVEDGEEVRVDDLNFLLNIDNS
ncbi:GNAT family N-acetyltransferase [Patescibacteria group bacterium]